MSKKILVTGGAGFIGSHLVDRLVDESNSVSILDNLEPQVHGGKIPEHANANAEYIIGDVTNKEDVQKALQDAEVVFHLAAQVGVGQSMYDIARYTKDNAFGTALLLDTIINGNFPVEKIIVASSMSVYGEGAYECENCGIVYPKLRNKEQLKQKEWEMRCPSCGKPARPAPTNEEKPLHPTSVYAISKKTQEELALNVGKAYSIPVVALRYFNVYGPRQSLGNPYTGVAAIFSSRIKNNNQPIIFEDGMQSRDFIHVSDIVEANMLAMKNSNADYDYFNVGTGKAVTVKQIAEILIKLNEKNLSALIENKFRDGDIRHCFADISKIRRKLSFKPKVDFESGMKSLVSWSQDANATDRVEQALGELKERGLLER